MRSLNDVRLRAFWLAVTERLRDASMQPRSPAPPAVYRSIEDYSDAEGPESAPWYRIVVVPTAPVIIQPDDPRSPVRLEFLVVAEANNFLAKGYDVGRSLEAIQSHAYDLLDGWFPPLGSLQYVQAAQSIYRQGQPQPTPLYDEERGLWYNSSEYRTSVVAPPTP